MPCGERSTPGSDRMGAHDNMEYLPGATVAFDGFRPPHFLRGQAPLRGQPGETFFSRPKKLLSATFHTLPSIRYLPYATFHTLL